jgi:hypothetical protein
MLGLQLTVILKKNPAIREDLAMWKNSKVISKVIIQG